MRLEFDDSAVVAYYFGDECKSQARTRRLGADERLEQAGGDVGRNARTVVAHADLERQADRFGPRADLQPHALAVSGGQRDFAVDAFFANGFRGVLDQVEEDLDQRVARPQHVRQRRIVDLGEADVLGEARLGEPLHVIEHLMDVEAFAPARPLVGERLHPVDQFDDAVGLLADQPGQRPILVGGGGLEQLRRAADARQRVLDLVGQHGAERGHRPRGAAVGELPVHFFSN